MVQGVQDVLGGLGLGAIAGQLADLQLGELLDTPPPGLDEAVAIAKVHTTPYTCALLHIIIASVASVKPSNQSCGKVCTLHLRCFQLGLTYPWHRSDYHNIR